MKIGTRVALLLSIPILLLILGFGWFTERKSQALLREELARAGRTIALMAQFAMEDYLRDHQIEDARELVDRITGRERILGFRLVHKDGSLIYQSSLPEGAPPLDQGLVETVLHTGRASESRTSAGDEPVVSFIYPLASSTGETVGAVQVMELESFVEEATLASRRSIVVLTIAVTLATAGILLYVMHFSVTRPIEDLVRSFREMSSKDLGGRVPVRRADEIGRLASEFNLMCERLVASQRALEMEQEERRRTEAGLRRAERLASVGRLAAGLAHEIGSPLNVIGGRAGSLLRRMDDGDQITRHNLEIIVAQIDRITRIVRGMLDFARSRASHRGPTRIDAAVARVLELLEIQIARRGVRVESEIPEDLPLVMADSDQLHQVFLNLATNALDAMPEGGVLGIRALVEAGRAAGTVDFVVVRFQDNGVGIPAAHLDRIFDPFFSTKDVGEGTGLGLSVSYGIVREHGGWIDVESEVGQWTRMSVHIPVAGASVAEVA